MYKLYLTQNPSIQQLKFRQTLLKLKTPLRVLVEGVEKFIFSIMQIS